MAFLGNDAINRVNLHYGVQAFAQNAGGIFILAFLLKAGLSIPATLLTFAAILTGRFIMRPAILPLARRWGLKPMVIIGALGVACQYPLLPLVHGLGWPLAALGLVAISFAELARVPPAQWLTMWLGASWRVCSSLVILLSLPIFAGLLWSYRTMAPTRLRTAGAVAGLAAGAWSAMLYCLHCPEVSAIFVLCWYTLGIGLAALLGAWLGPYLMRW